MCRNCGFEGDEDNDTGFVISFNAAQQGPPAQTLFTILLGHKCNLKLPVLPALQRNLIVPGKNKHLKS